MKKIVKPVSKSAILLGLTFLMLLSANAQNMSTNFNGNASNNGCILNDNATLSVYPNPAADEAKIVFNAAKYDIPYQVRITNNAGIILTNIAGTTVQGQNTVRFHVGSFPSGIYYVQLLTSEGRETIKLLKQPLNSL